MSSSPVAPGEVELYASFRQHLGPRCQAAGLRVQFHYNQTPGIQFKVTVRAEYETAIGRGLTEAMAARFPEFPPTGSIWITEVTDNEIDSSESARERSRIPN